MQVKVSHYLCLSHSHLVGSTRFLQLVDACAELRGVRESLCCQLRLAATIARLEARCTGHAEGSHCLFEVCVPLIDFRKVHSMDPGQLLV